MTDIGQSCRRSENVPIGVSTNSGQASPQILEDLWVTRFYACLALCLLLLGGCSMDRVPGGLDSPSPNLERKTPSLEAGNPRGGRLGSRPSEPSLAPLGPGLHQLGLETGRDGLVFVPAGYRAGVPAPLVVMLHGARGDARGGIDPFLGLADEAGLLLLAPDSRLSTWDVILGDFGPDVAFLDRALEFVFERYSVDPDRIAIEGFSDGASYALSLGLTNGDLFDSILAFSPGFLSPGKVSGSPAIFISHGTRDRVLPIDSTSRRIVPSLRRVYDLQYTEFDGPHVIPPELAREALLRFLG